MKFNIFRNCALLALTALTLNACSVGMALSGKKEPDFSVLKKGATRGEVEMQLGEPRTASTDAHGVTQAVYEYELGNEPSPGRAVAHGAMDVLTLGIWEVVGTPVELFTGDKFIVQVVYDKNDHVISLLKPSKK